MGKLGSKVIKSSIAAATTSLIANVLNLDDTKVGQILGVAIPVITFVVADDKSISNKLFGRSKDHKKGDRMTREEGEKEFFDVFGDKGHAMSKFIAKETGATEEEVNGVLGMTMSVLETGLGRFINEEDVDEESFNLFFKEEAEEESKNNPNLFNAAKKVVF